MIDNNLKISGRRGIRDLNKNHFSLEKNFEKIPNTGSVLISAHNVRGKNRIIGTVKDFLKSTTLHGLKYTAEENLTLFERVFFIVSFILVVFLSCYFINNVFTKWSASPIIISTDPKPTFTSKIPFPAVTICSLNQARKSRVANIKPESLNYSLLMSLCGSQNNSDTVKNLLSTWRSFKSLILDVSMPCKDMLLYCEFGGINETCFEMFVPTLTDDGLCCTFNSIDLKFLLQNYTHEDELKESVYHKMSAEPIDWSPEKGYPSELPKNFYPRIAQGTGRQKGLSLLLDVSKDEYFCSSSKGYGFKVLIHNPIEQPKISNFGFLITAGKETRVNVRPVLNEANPKIRSIRQNVRKCLFSDEGELTFYRLYSRKNCEAECEAKKVYEKCKCILYYMPRILFDIAICRPNQYKCAKQVQTTIQSHSNNVSCEYCLPGCFELSYEYTSSSNEISSDKFMSSDVVVQSKEYNDAEIDDLSILHLYYSSNFLRAQIKEEIIGFTEFLSNVGGLLGLFMGFSIFSLIEIVYFISLRPYCTYKKYLNRRKIEENEKVEKVLVLGTKQPWFIDSKNKLSNESFYNFPAQQELHGPKLQQKPKNKSFLNKCFSNLKKNDEIFPYCE